MTPATCGLAIDVPEITSAWLPGWKPDGSDKPVQPAATVQVWPVCTDVMFRPGAARSGFRRSGEPKMWRGPRDENDASVSPPLCPCSVTFAGWLDLSAVPSTNVMRKVGIVIGVTMLTSSAVPAGGEPGTLSTRTMAIAPAFWQFKVLVLMVHVPR